MSLHTQEPGKNERLEARVSHAQKMFFKQAAELQGSTLSEFIVASLQKAATQVVYEHDLMKLTGHDREIFLSAILQPSIPSGRLNTAATRYKELMQ